MWNCMSCGTDYLKIWDQRSLSLSSKQNWRGIIFRAGRLPDCPRNKNISTFSFSILIFLRWVITSTTSTPLSSPLGSIRPTTAWQTPLSLDSKCSSDSGKSTGASSTQSLLRHSCGLIQECISTDTHTGHQIISILVQCVVILTNITQWCRRSKRKV